MDNEGKGSEIAEILRTSFMDGPLVLAKISISMVTNPYSEVFDHQVFPPPPL